MLTTLPDDWSAVCQSRRPILYTASVIPTVREVLALPVVAPGAPRVVGGAAHLDRRIRWVHLSDTADLTGLLQGGELVMGTGLTLAQSPERVQAYLRMLADLDVCGLIVELGLHVSEMPSCVAGLADELALPVVALDRPIRFVDVTELVHRMIVADRYEELQFARAAHEAFTSLNIGRAAPTDIVTKASEILTAPVVLEDLNRHVLAFCRAGTAAAALLDGWAERSRRHSGSADVEWTAVPVGVGVEQWGRLVLPGHPVEPGRARMVLERAAQSLQLQRMLEQDRDALLVQALGGLLDDLVSGRITDETDALARARALGLAVSARYVPLVIKVPRGSGGDAIAQGAADRRVLAAVRQAVGSAGLTALGSVRREGTVALLLTCPYPTAVERSLDAVCAGLADRLAGRAGLADWAAGTAAASAGLITAAAGLVEAEHVAEVGTTMPGPRRLFRSADVRLPGLFALLRNDHRVQAFAETELGRLLAHDARTGDNLMAVLRAFLGAGGSKTDTARRVGLSRPTLYARLASIERILGVPLDSVESRTSLHAALMIIDAAGRP
jgi:purine catabolism regulator